MTVVVVATCAIMKLAGLAHFQTVGSNTLAWMYFCLFLPIKLMNSSVVVELLVDSTLTWNFVQKHHRFQNGCEVIPPKRVLLALLSGWLTLI